MTENIVTAPLNQSVNVAIQNQSKRKFHSSKNRSKYSCMRCAKSAFSEQELIFVFVLFLRKKKP